MKNLQSLLSQPLTWTFSKNAITLKSNDKFLLELTDETINRAAFELDGGKYIIRNEGFWNPKAIIEKAGEQLLVLKSQFLGSKGEVTFKNGKVYFCKTTNSPLVTLTFFTDDEREILQYRLVASVNPQSIKVTMDVQPSSIPADELLMLIILGCYSFKGIVIENINSDFIIMAAA